MGTVCRYTYDGDGGRTKRLDRDGTVHYVGRHFERNVGSGSRLKIARGLNNLWNKGGLQYAPPLR